LTYKSAKKIQNQLQLGNKPNGKENMVTANECGSAKRELRRWTVNEDHIEWWE